MLYMLDYTIISNNPLVNEKYRDKTTYLETGAEGVLVAVRDMVHLGAKILNHPLSGGLLPGASPYKSLVVSDATGAGAEGLSSPCVDYESLYLIEHAIRVLQRPPEGFAGFSGQVLLDFQVLDLDLLESALA